MKFTLGILTLILSFLYSCDARNENKSKQITQEKTPTRNHSYANIEAAHTTHLHLDLAVDFEQKKLDKNLSNWLLSKAIIFENFYLS